MYIKKIFTFTFTTKAHVDELQKKHLPRCIIIMGASTHASTNVLRVHKKGSTQLATSLHTYLHLRASLKENSEQGKASPCRWENALHLNVSYRFFLFKSLYPPANTFSKLHCSDLHLALDPHKRHRRLNSNPNHSPKSKKWAATGWMHRWHKQPRLIFVRWTQHKQLELRISIWHSWKGLHEWDGETITRLLGANFNLPVFKALKEI